MKRFLCLGGVLCQVILWSACGDVFRPIIIPNPPEFPSPAAAHSIFIASDNGTVNGGVETPQIGGAMSIDVSGDTDMSQRKLGLVPVHAVQQTANQIIVANQSAPGADQDSLSKVTFSGTTISTVSTITLPTGSAPNFVATTETGEVYVSAPGNVPPVNASPALLVVDTARSTVTYTVPVGLSPVAVAETPDTKKLYVASVGDGTIAAFNTGVNGPTLRGVSSQPASAPIWLAARNDSQRVYILEVNGTLAYLDTTTTSGPDTLYETPISVPGAPNFWYDVILNRLYIPGQGLVNGSMVPAVTIVDVSQAAPAVLAVVAIPSIDVPGVGSTPATVIAATSLPDATRAYFGSYASATSTVTISSVVGDGTNATYTYALTSGASLVAGMGLDIAGLVDSQGNPLTAFQGPVLISNVISGTSDCPSTCFQAANTTTLAALAESGTGSSKTVFPQVTVFNATSLTFKTNVAIPGFPDATVPSSGFYVPTCSTTRDMIGPTGNGFRIMMASGGDSTRAYLSSCDGGIIDIIRTDTDTYYLNLPAPFSARPPYTGAAENPPQSPVFMIAGP